ALIIAGVLLVATMQRGHEWTPMLTAAAGGAIAIFLAIGDMRRLYASWRLQSLDDEFRSVLVAWGITCGALIVLAFLAKSSSNYSRLVTLAWFLSTPAFLLSSRLAVRLVLRTARKSGWNTRTVAIAGSSPLAYRVIGNLEETAAFGLRMVGVFDDRSAERIAAEGGDPARLAGDLDELVAKARGGEIDYVFIAMPMRAEQRIVQLVNRLADTTASVYVIPNFFVFDLMRAHMTVLGGLPAVSVYESPFDGLNGLLKRVEDLVLGGFFLLLASLPMLVIAVSIKLTTG